MKICIDQKSWFSLQEYKVSVEPKIMYEFLTAVFFRRNWKIKANSNGTGIEQAQHPDGLYIVVFRIHGFGKVLFRKAGLGVCQLQALFPFPIIVLAVADHHASFPALEVEVLEPGRPGLAHGLDFGPVGFT